MRDLEFRTPLDPDHIRLLGLGKKTGGFDESNDVWAAGVTILCFVFGKDFNDFYDWAGFKVRTDRLGEAVQTLATLGYPPEVVRVVGEALDQNHITRVSVGRMRQILKGQS